MSQFLPSLDVEIARLEKAIETIPEVVKLRELKRVRALYQQDVTHYAPTSPLFHMTTSPLLNPAAMRSIETTTPGRKMSAERQRALDVIAEQLAGVRGPIRTVTLLEMLTGAGIEIGGNDPLNNLSALLSTSGRFVAHGRSGWTLKSEENQTVSDPPMAEDGNPGAGGAGAV
jgi:hypothetical protein